MISSLVSRYIRCKCREGGNLYLCMNVDKRIDELWNIVKFLKLNNNCV